VGPLVLAFLGRFVRASVRPSRPGQRTFASAAMPAALSLRPCRPKDEPISLGTSGSSERDILFHLPPSGDPTEDAEGGAPPSSSITREMHRFVNRVGVEIPGTGLFTKGIRKTASFQAPTTRLRPGLARFYEPMHFLVFGRRSAARASASSVGSPDERISFAAAPGCSRRWSSLACHGRKESAALASSAEAKGCAVRAAGERWRERTPKESAKRADHRIGTNLLHSFQQTSKFSAAWCFFSIFEFSTNSPHRVRQSTSGTSDVHRPRGRLRHEAAGMHAAPSKARLPAGGKAFGHFRP